MDMNATIRVNGERRRLEARTVIGLLEAEGLDPEARGLAVALNGAVLPRRDWPGTPISAGDEVEIVKPFRGG